MKFGDSGKCERCGRLKELYPFNEDGAILTPEDDEDAVWWCERCVMGNEYPDAEDCGAGCGLKIDHDETPVIIDGEPWHEGCAVLYGPSA